MDRNQIKHEEQVKAIKIWIANGCKGSFECCTGFGKTRLGVLAAKGFHSKYGDGFKILVLTPTETIRDTAWKEEFKKWKAEKVFKACVETVCIQTAYKWVGKKYDLVICDEAHNFTSEEYSKFFENNEMRFIMGLSATLDVDQKQFLRRIGAPVVYSIGIEKARKLKLVSDFVIYNYGVELSLAEQIEYDKADATFKRTFPIFDRDLKIMFKCMDKNFFQSWCTNKGYDYDNVAGFPFQCNAAIAKRKNIIYDCAAKIDAIKEISGIMPDKLGIIFSERIEFADKVTGALGESCVSFHSKITKKRREENLKKLMDGRTKVNRISTGKALNEGANIPKCNLAVIASATGKARSTIQRIGRSIRFEEDKTAIIVRLYVKGSQEEKWVENAQKSMTVEQINDLNQIEV
jgi:superfamily II DNA or RNA helicase